MQQPTEKMITAFSVSGITVRTKNVDEMNPLTAKIAPLWGRFYQEGIAQKLQAASSDTVVYGVYSDYESDYMGYFNVTAGVKVEHGDFSIIHIPAGKYLVFERTGVLPMAVIEAWKDVWTFFNNHSNYQRSYNIDFEEYSSHDKVAVYIGVE